MSGSLDLGQPVHSGNGNSSRLSAIMAGLFFIVGAGVFLAIKVMPDGEAALAEKAEQHQRMLERSFTVAEQGAAFVSCVEVACEEARGAFFEHVGENHSYELAKTVMDSNGSPIGYMYIDRRLKMITIVEEEN